MKSTGTVLMILVLVILCISSTYTTSARLADNVFTKFLNSDEYDDVPETKWAVLVAGSKDWTNYRHQADVCHAYQVLTNGGLSKENIIVFMYDDIAYNSDNPFPGRIYNSFQEIDVYEGVEVDYAGENATADNLLAVLLGNPFQLIGGNGKVLSSSSRDRVFMFYSGHGNVEILGMPVGPVFKAKPFIELLQANYEYNYFKSMVIYINACKSGSIFTLLPNNISVYATTSANASENSYGTYCGFGNDDGGDGVCLGSLYSVAWLQHTEAFDRATLGQQYKAVQFQVLNSWSTPPSQVQQLGDISIANDFVSTYMGSRERLIHQTRDYHSSSSSRSSNFEDEVPCAEHELDYYRNRVKRSRPDSPNYARYKKELDERLAQRKLEDDNFAGIRKLLFKDETGSKVKNVVNEVQRNNCFKSLMDIYWKNCGSISEYGMRLAKEFDKMCDAGVTDDEFMAASTQVCSA
ncbi:Peptidase C13, legumain [Parasponia andersonii]|uniref:Peptidase C13, legumain n=1 Tax=Parasponia andersonii TaxID=3476 RepID=A0A2P5AFN2_PARAD|nr:Peptidase C13, legumain [Parasponia andersonii]